MGSKRTRGRETPIKQTDTKQVQAEPLGGGNITMDAFVNMMANMGAGSTNLTEGAEYPLTRLTRNYGLMNSLYRSHWLVRRIIDVVPEDMMKNWIKLTGSITPDAETKFNRAIRRMQLKDKILKGLKWGRLYGGAAGIMMIDGVVEEEQLCEPLDLQLIMPGSFKGLLIVDRWSGVTPLLELCSDLDDPEFGLPDFYQVTLSDGRTLKIHHSRIVRFLGRDLPFWEQQAETYWGASEVEHVFDEVKKRDNTSFNIASLVFLANLRVLKMQDLGQLIASGNEQSKKRLYDTVQAQAHLMNNNGMYIMDKDDDFDTKQYSFSGLSDVYELFQMDVAGAAEIPVTKLFGRSPAGMNATGESDLQNYYDMIGEKQEKELRPVLDKILPVLMVSLFGGIHDDFDFDFNPSMTSNDDKKAELASKKTTAIIEAYNAGLISQKIALKEMKQMEDTTGMWSNISDDDVNNASEELQVPDMPTQEGDPLDGTENLEAENQNRNVLPESSTQHSGQNQPRDPKRKFGRGNNREA